MSASVHNCAPLSVSFLTGCSGPIIEFWSFGATSPLKFPAELQLSEQEILDASQIYFGYTGNMKFIQDGVDHLLDNNLLRKKNEAYYKLIG